MRFCLDGKEEEGLGPKDKGREQREGAAEYWKKDEDRGAPPVLSILYTTCPALTRWAKVWHAYGVEEKNAG